MSLCLPTNYLTIWLHFLESDRRLEYDASACEIGVFSFRTLEEVEEIDLAVSSKDHELISRHPRPGPLEIMRGV